VKTRVIIILFTALTSSIVQGATRLAEQSVGSMSGRVAGSGLQAESFVGLPWASVSLAGSITESIVFPAVVAETSPLVRIPLYLQPDKKSIQPKDSVSIQCILDLRGTGLSVGGYACLMTWDTTSISYTGYSASKVGRFTKPQVNDKLVEQGQLVFSEVAAEGDTGRIDLLNVTFQGREIEDSARCSFELKLLSINTARTFQNISNLVDISPASLLIKKVEIDSIPPVIYGLEAFSYTYDTQGPYIIKVRVEDPILSQVLLNYRRSGTQTYDMVVMTVSGEYFSGPIPGQPTGTTIEYYIEAADTIGNVSKVPADYQTAPYSFRVVIKQEPYLDANNDGKLNIMDVISLLLMARNNPGDPRLDWNGDGKFTVADAVMMLDEILLKNRLSGIMMLASAGESKNIPALEISADESDYLRLMLSQMQLSPEVKIQFDAMLGKDRASLPKIFSLEQNCPNPFNPSTMITYSIPDGERLLVNLSVYDLRGRLVRTLVRGDGEPGEHCLFWDGTDAESRALPSGIYLYRLKAGGYVETRKMILLK